MTNKFFKTVALALAAITLSLPLSTEALAASHNDGKAAHKVEYRHDNRDLNSIQNHNGHKQPHKVHNNKHTVIVHKDKPPVHRDKHREPPRKVVVKHHRPEHRPEYRPARHEYRPAPPPKKHHSATGNFVTGAIVGAVIGAIVANNT